jgi:hypothetical protein
MKIIRFNEHSDLGKYYREISNEEISDLRNDKISEKMTKSEINFIENEFPENESIKFLVLVRKKSDGFGITPEGKMEDVFVDKVEYDLENDDNMYSSPIYGYSIRIRNVNFCVIKKEDDYFEVVFTTFSRTKNVYEYYLCDQFEGLKILVSDFRSKGKL